MGLNKKEMASYGIGAVGKDMVYMFCASYILYYYQDILGVSAIAMGIILLAIFCIIIRIYLGLVR